MKPECTLIAYLYAKPEKREELLKILHSFVKPSRAEPACVDYHLHVSNNDPNLFIFYENWRTRKGRSSKIAGNSAGCILCMRISNGLGRPSSANVGRHDFDGLVGQGSSKDGPNSSN